MTDTAKDKCLATLDDTLDCCAPDCPCAAQGTREWLIEKAGHVSASKISDIMAKTKSGGISASRKNYAAQIICERLTGLPTETFKSKEMEWGILNEPLARDNYSFIKNVAVKIVGFLKHPRIKWSGASSDGMVGEDGLVELKCPNTATHLETLLGAPIDNGYLLQMQWQMSVTGRQWCDFISFDPRLPVELQIKIIRVRRDSALIMDLENEVRTFLKEIDEKLERLKAL